MNQRYGSGNSKIKSTSSITSSSSTTRYGSGRMKSSSTSSLTSSSSTRGLYQGGPIVELFSASGRQASDANLSRQYNKVVKSMVVLCRRKNGGLRLPNDGRGLGLYHPFIVIQLFVDASEVCNIEFGVQNESKQKRRILCSTAFRDVAPSALHAQVPLPQDVVLPGRWLNLCIDLSDIVHQCFGEEFRCLDSMVIGPSCVVRRVCTVREPPPMHTSDESFNTLVNRLYPSMVALPTKVDFARDVVHSNVIISESLLRHLNAVHNSGAVYQQSHEPPQRRSEDISKQPMSRLSSRASARSLNTQSAASVRSGRARPRPPLRHGSAASSRPNMSRKGRKTRSNVRRAVTTTKATPSTTTTRPVSIGVSSGKRKQQVRPKVHEVTITTIGNAVVGPSKSSPSRVSHGQESSELRRHHARYNNDVATAASQKKPPSIRYVDGSIDKEPLESGWISPSPQNTLVSSPPISPSKLLRMTTAEDSTHSGASSHRMRESTSVNSMKEADARHRYDSTLYEDRLIGRPPSSSSNDTASYYHHAYSPPVDRVLHSHDSNSEFGRHRDVRSTDQCSTGGDHGNISTGSRSPPPPLATRTPPDEDNDHIDLLYDPILKCYFDPTTNKYYELKA